MGIVTTFLLFLFYSVGVIVGYMLAIRNKKEELRIIKKESYIEGYKNGSDAVVNFVTEKLKK